MEPGPHDAARRGAPRPPLSIAPMMDRTDRHFRWLARRITRHTLLYTEMVTAHALVHGDRARLLAHDPSERPLALQLGGDDPGMLAECAKMAEDAGYTEVNLNVGCPSERVQRGRFGACLMREPSVVARAVDAMRAAVRLPVTVKHRIGVDELDRYEDMLAFVDTVREANADAFIVHARKAWLAGLSPKQNRSVPPLRHQEVWRLKRERPEQAIETNGGIVDLDTAAAHLEHVDAVMIGRAAWDRPMLFADADRRFWGRNAPVATRREVLGAFAEYAAGEISAGATPTAVLRNALNLYAGQPGTRVFKRALGEIARAPDAHPRLRDRLLSVVDAVEELQASMGSRARA